MTLNYHNWTQSDKETFCTGATTTMTPVVAGPKGSKGDPGPQAAKKKKGD